VFNAVSQPKGLLITGALHVTDGSTLTLQGYIDNVPFVDLSHPAGYAGIYMDDANIGTGTTLSIDGSTNGGSVTLTGGGDIFLSDSATNFIDGAGVGGALSTLVSNNTISGAGSIGDGDGSLGLTNNGTIDATFTDNSLLIDIGTGTGHGTLTNTGNLESSGAGIPGGGVTLPMNLNTSGGLFIQETDISGGNMVIATDSFIDSKDSVTNNVRVKFDNNPGGTISASGNTGEWFLEFGTTEVSPQHTAQAFSGTTAIEGFAGSVGGPSDEIDIQQLHFAGGHAAASWNQVVSGVGGFGTLELTGGDGKTKLDVTLMGNYLGSTDFQVTHDSLAGTVVTTTNSSNAESFAL
jgi:hypothetical protein